MRTPVGRLATTVGHLLLEGLVVSGTVAVGDDSGTRFVRAWRHERRWSHREAARGVILVEAYLRAESARRRT
jgi:uncharacterized membrane protein